MSDLLFAPYAQPPISSALEQTDTGQPFATAPRTHPELLLVHPDGNSTPMAGPELSVLGPDGVIGIDPRSFVRCDPPVAASDVEPNYLASVEVRPIELPWLFTPAKPGDVGGGKRLRPWIVLVVVEAAPDLLRPGQPLPMMTVEVDQLPNLDDSWAWAHVQTPDPAAVLPPGLPPVISPPVARLVCPRHLDPKKRWLACVVPAFVGGLKAVRIAAAGDDTAHAWDTAAGGSVTLPVFHSWEFSTGEDGDFESLIDRLRPVSHEQLQTLGVRIVDASHPWLRDDVAGAAGATVPVPGALRAFNDGPKGSTQSEFLDAFKRQLESELNAPARRLQPVPSEANSDPDTTGAVAAPIYGGKHLVVDSVPIPDPAGADPDWVQDLNYSIATRVAAGLGATYIRTHQEELMARAWEQVGAIREANDRRRLAELAIAVAGSVHRRHIETMTPGETVLLSAPAAHRLRSTSAGQTLATELLVSTMADGAATSAFARLLRPSGPVARASGVVSSGVLERSMLDEISVPKPATVLDRSPGGATAANDTPLGQTVVQAVTSTSAAVGASRLIALQAVADVARENGLVDQAYAVDTQLNAVAIDRNLLREGALSSIRPLLQSDLSSFQASTTSVVSVLNTSTFIEAAQKVTKFGVQVKTADVSARVVNLLRPSDTLIKRLAAAVVIPPELGNPFDVRPVMAYPRFPVPTALALLKDAPEWFLPGIGDIPSESVTLLHPGEHFIESFMVGLAHEFNRELQWREYPTDLRGTPFDRFWPRPDGAPDIQPIHTWRGRLGEHLDQGGEGVVVLFVRGTVVRRFPNMVVAAAPRQGMEDPNVWKKPFFVIPVDAQTAAYAFKMGEDEVNQVGDDGRSKWFFVFQEHGYRIRFGFDEPEDPPVELKEWNDLSWAGVPNEGGRSGFAFAGKPIPQPSGEQNAGDAIWGRDAADTARITFQQPVRVFRSARTLINGA